MKASHILALLQNNYTTVKVVYREQDTKEYTFKALLRDNLQPNDFVVIPAINGFGFTLGRIRSVDEEPNIDTDTSYEYKWIAQKVDMTAYNAIIEVETRFAKTVARLERKNVQAAAVAQFKASFAEGSQEQADLNALINDSIGITNQI